MPETLTAWYKSHSADYDAVCDRLARTNDAFMHGRLDDAAKMLEKSYMFAVLSIQTERSRHENAFVAHYSGNLNRKEAALETVYGGHKKNWIAKTFKNVNWKELAIAVRSHGRNERYETLLSVMVDNVTGVSYRKASFVLAMLGFTRFGCIDSNVANYAGVDTESDFYSAAAYLEKCDEIFDSVDVDESPFVTQWAIYDFERGEHARHMTFFNELGV